MVFEWEKVTLSNPRTPRAVDSQRVGAGGQVRGSSDLCSGQSPEMLGFGGDVG